MIYEESKPFESIEVSFKSGPKGDRPLADENLLKTQMFNYLDEHSAELFYESWVDYQLEQWRLDNGENTIFSNGALGQGYAELTSINQIDNHIVANATMDDYYAIPHYGGGIVVVKFDLDTMDEQPAELYLDINRTGAFPVYYHGTHIAANVIKKGDIGVFILSSSNIHNTGSTKYILLATDGGGTHLTGHSEIRQQDINVNYIDANNVVQTKTISVPTRRLYFADGDNFDILDPEAIQALEGGFVVLDENGKVPTNDLPVATDTTPGISTKPIIFTERFDLGEFGTISGYAQKDYVSEWFDDTDHPYKLIERAISIDVTGMPVSSYTFSIIAKSIEYDSANDRWRVKITIKNLGSGSMTVPENIYCDVRFLVYN